MGGSFHKLHTNTKRTLLPTGQACCGHGGRLNDRAQRHFFSQLILLQLEALAAASRAVETHSCVVFESHFSSTGVQGSIVGFTARFHRLSNLTLLRSSNNETTTPATATAKALRSSRLGEGPGLSMSSSAIDIAMCAALPVT